MDCPRCDKPVVEDHTPDGAKIFYCDACGWGKEKAREKKQGAEVAQIRIRYVPLKTFLKLILLWLLSVLVVFGPFAALVFGIPIFVEAAEINIEPPTPAGVAGFLTPGYWIAIAIYLLISILLSPSYDPDNLGLFGSRWIDNPLSYEDDFNRTMRSLAILLLPGKYVWYTLRGTLRVAQRLLLGR
jgi:hypothetical protein